MSLFAQTTKLSATAGNVDVLLAKFEDAAEIQKDNAACEVMIARDMPPLVSAAPESIRLDSATGKGLSRAPHSSRLPV